MFKRTRVYVLYFSSFYFYVRLLSWAHTSRVGVWGRMSRIFPFSPALRWCMTRDTHPLRRPGRKSSIITTVLAAVSLKIRAILNIQLYTFLNFRPWLHEDLPTISWTLHRNRNWQPDLKLSWTFYRAIYEMRDVGLTDRQASSTTQYTGREGGKTNRDAIQVGH